MKKKIILTLLVLGCSLSLFGCTDADMASRNLSKDADMFKVNRRIVFYNGINGDYILSIEGFCSLGYDRTPTELNLTCKVGENSYKKRFLGLSDNVTYFAEQLESKDVSISNYKVIFKPSAIIPDIDLH